MGRGRGLIRGGSRLEELGEVRQEGGGVVIEDREEGEELEQEEQTGGVEEDERGEGRRKIRLGAWNLNGMFEKLSLNGVCEYINTFDIACLSETFTYSSFDFGIKFSDYIAIHHPAKKFNIRGRPSGGLVVLVRKSLERYVTIIDTKISHVICVKIAREYLNTARDILYVGTYVHPAGSVFYTEEDHECTLEAVEQFLLDELEEGEELSYILAGDLNARVGDWELKVGNVEEEDEEEGDEEVLERVAQDGIVNDNGQKLVQICTAFNATPLNGLKRRGFDGNYTFIGRRGSSTIDHYVCSVELLDKVISYKTGDRVESQHMPIELELGGGEEGNEGREGREEGEVTKVRWKEAKRGESINILGRPEIERGLREAYEALDINIDEGVDRFDKVMETINKPMVSKYKIGEREVEKKKWFDKECERKKKEARRALTQMNKINAKRRREDYKRAKDSYLDKRLEYQKIIREKRRKYKREMQEKLISSRHDTKAFWAEIRKISFKKQKLANISIETWGEHFNQVFNPDGIQWEVEEGHGGDEARGVREVREGREEELAREGRVEEEEEEEGEEGVEEDLDEEISREEIERGINRLKKGKAGGLDEVSAELLQLSKDKILGFLYKLFNKMYETGTFPIKWAKAIVVPLHKKGEVNEANNYRGVSLLSITSKIFSGILNQRLYNWAEENGKISREQAGFRKSYSTVDHIFTIYSMASNYLFGRRRGKFYVCFVDFKKAFDTVKRERLWEVLNRQGVSDKMLNAIKAMYNRVKAVVRYGSDISGEINCPMGVRQGCLLSPLLFSLLITELAQGIAEGGRHGYQFSPGVAEIFALLFADDIALIATTPQGLQNQINNLKRGAERLGLVVNLEKTKVMVFRKGGFLGRLERWYYGEERIEVVNKYKYLGYTLTTKLSVDLALAECAGKAKGRIVSIFRALYKLGKIDMGIFFQLFDSQVKPILLYGAEIWGMKGREIIEKVHLFACKKLLGVSAKTPNSFVYTELNRYPLVIDARMRVFKYWAKILGMEGDRIPRQAYERELRELNKENGWGRMIQEYLIVNGYGNVWEEQDGGLVYSLGREIKQRMIDIFWQEEHRSMEESRSRRFVTYLSFKEGHEREEYLNGIRVPKFRRALTRLRFGVNELRGNRRYVNEQANRKCPYCDEDEDEKHILVVCPTYRELRVKYISKFWITLNNVTLKDLLENSNQDIVRGVAIFVYYALELRDRR